MSAPRRRRAAVAAPKKKVMRKAPTVKGYGAYNVDKGRTYYKRYRQYKEAENNQSLGSKIGSQLGSFLGHGAQQVLKAITGFGEYNVDHNSILEGGMSPPTIVNTIQKGGFIVRHREYVSDIVASTAFSNHTFDINPGLPGTFPYLSQIAKAFELYRMRGLVYEFKSMSSDSVLSASASTALGTVAMATQYNSLNPGFTNLIAMENHEFSNACKPSCDFYHPVECKKSLISVSELYTRTGAVPDNADIRLYDLGQFNIATSGMQNATGVIGQLWCTYEVEFYQAKYDAPTSILSDHVRNSSISNTQWLGSAHSFAGGCSLGLGIETNTITFPTNVRDGTFFVNQQFRSTAGAGAFTRPTIAIGPDSSYGSLQQFWDDDTVLIVSAPTDAVATSANYSLSFILKVLKPGVTVTFSAGAIPANAVSDLWVTQLDADITD